MSAILARHCPRCRKEWRPTGTTPARLMHPDYCPACYEDTPAGRIQREQQVPVIVPGPLRIPVTTQMRAQVNAALACEFPGEPELTEPDDLELLLARSVELDQLKRQLDERARRIAADQQHLAGGWVALQVGEQRLARVAAGLLIWTVVVAFWTVRLIDWSGAPGPLVGALTLLTLWATWLLYRRWRDADRAAGAGPTLGHVGAVVDRDPARSA